MADTTYNVKVKYTVDKANAESDANKIASAFDRVASAVAGAFAIHRILDFSKRLVGLQAEAERFTLTFATMLTGYGAPGFTKGAQDFQKAMSVSQQLMMQIRLEAAKLPGTAEEMMEIMRAAMPGAIQSGKAIMGPDSAFEMSKRLMAAGNLLQIPGGSTTVAREFQAMMEGRAQTRNDLFARIRGLMNDGKGIGSKEFNALSESGRWEQISKALSKLVDPALPAYAQTWKAISTTTENWAQQLARVATGGAFETLKEHLKGINDWLKTNQTSVEDMLKSFGEGAGNSVGEAFNSMRDAFSFLVEHKGSILPILENLGVIMLGGKLANGFGKGGAGNAMMGAGLGLGVNAMTGGSMDMQGLMMGVAGGLTSFGGALGIASAAALLFGATMNEIDQARRAEFADDSETASLLKAVSDSVSGRQYSVIKQIIQDQKLAPDMYLNETKLGQYIDRYAPDASMLEKQNMKDIFDSVAARMRDTIAFGPSAPTAEQTLMQKLYDKPVPRKGDVNVQVNIKQDISQAEDPDRILVRTQQAIEDALIRPIESGNNKFSVLR